MEPVSRSEGYIARNGGEAMSRVSFSCLWCKRARSVHKSCREKEYCDSLCRSNAEMPKGCREPTRQLYDHPRQQFLPVGHPRYQPYDGPEFVELWEPSFTAYRDCALELFSEETSMLFLDDLGRPLTIPYEEHL